MSDRFSAWWSTLPTWRASFYVGIVMAFVLFFGIDLPRVADAGWTDRALVGLVIDFLGALLVWWAIAAVGIAIVRRTG